MTGQDRKGSSKWMWFIGAVLVYGAVVSFLNGAANADLREAIPAGGYNTESHQIVEDVEQFQAVRADGDHTSNTCWFADTSLFNATITIAYPDFNPEDKVKGRWNADTNTIELMQPTGLNVQTVAHEVSHMVDTFMEQQPTIDPHYEAYMQGFWTWCVYEIMQHDIKCAEDPWCNVE